MMNLMPIFEKFPGSPRTVLIVIHKFVKARHSGMDIAGIQATWMYLSLPSLALDTRFPAGMTNKARTCV